MFDNIDIAPFKEKKPKEMFDNIENRILIREYNEDIDVELVGKLEKDCETKSNNNKEVSIFTNMIVSSDPLCRIRFYPVHIMLVAELLENGELVGVVRGCIKCVGTCRFEEKYVRLGCILGLRVSPRHRRVGIGSRLVKSVEEWLMGNGADYNFIATERNNVASISLFTSKCNYTNFSSLVIFVQPISLPLTSLAHQHVTVEKLQIDQAVSLYNKKLRNKDFYPTDMESILMEKMSLGTWVCYFREEKWVFSSNSSGGSKEKNEDMNSRTPSSWAIFSIWNSCRALDLHIRKSATHRLKLKYFHATLSHARDKIFPCLKLPINESIQKPYGFLFLYGLHGEGERLQELMQSIWSFASRLAENVRECKVIVTELGVSDPLIEHVPQGASMSCIHDLWYLKKVSGRMINEEDEEEDQLGQVGNVFVDPRDFF